MRTLALCTSLAVAMLCALVGVDAAQAQTPSEPSVTASLTHPRTIVVGFSADASGSTAPGEWLVGTGIVPESITIGTSDPSTKVVTFSSVREITLNLPIIGGSFAPGATTTLAYLQPTSGDSPNRITIGTTVLPSTQSSAPIQVSDAIGPTVVSATFADARSIDVMFDEAVTPSGRWSIAPSLGSVTASVGSTPNVIRLSTAQDASIQHYTITVPADITDRATVPNFVDLRIYQTVGATPSITEPLTFSVGFADSRTLVLSSNRELAADKVVPGNFAISAPDGTIMPDDDGDDDDIIALASASPTTYRAGPPSTVTLKLAGDMVASTTYTVTPSTMIEDKFGNKYAGSGVGVTYATGRLMGGGGSIDPNTWAGVAFESQTLSTFGSLVSTAEFDAMSDETRHRLADGTAQISRVRFDPAFGTMATLDSALDASEWTLVEGSNVVEGLTVVETSNAVDTDSCTRHGGMGILRDIVEILVVRQGRAVIFAHDTLSLTSARMYAIYHPDSSPSIPGTIPGSRSCDHLVDGNNHVNIETLSATTAAAGFPPDRITLLFSERVEFKGGASARTSTTEVTFDTDCVRTSSVCDISNALAIRDGTVKDRSFTITPTSSVRAALQGGGTDAFWAPDGRFGVSWAYANPTVGIKRGDSTHDVLQGRIIQDVRDGLPPAPASAITGSGTSADPYVQEFSETIHGTVSTVFNGVSVYKTDTTGTRTLIPVTVVAIDGSSVSFTSPSTIGASDHVEYVGIRDAAGNRSARPMIESVYRAGNVRSTVVELSEIVSGTTEARQWLVGGGTAVPTVRAEGVEGGLHFAPRADSSPAGDRDVAVSFEKTITLLHPPIPLSSPVSVQHVLPQHTSQADRFADRLASSGIRLPAQVVRLVIPDESAPMIASATLDSSTQVTVTLSETARGTITGSEWNIGPGMTFAGGALEGDTITLRLANRISTDVTDGTMLEYTGDGTITDATAELNELPMNSRIALTDGAPPELADDALDALYTRARHAGTTNDITEPVGIGGELRVYVRTGEDLHLPAAGDLVLYGTTGAGTISANRVDSRGSDYVYSRTVTESDVSGPVTFSLAVRDDLGNVRTLDERDLTTDRGTGSGHRTIVDTVRPTASAMFEGYTLVITFSEPVTGIPDTLSVTFPSDSVFSLPVTRSADGRSASIEFAGVPAVGIWTIVIPESIRDLAQNVRSTDSVTVSTIRYIMLSDLSYTVLDSGTPRPSPFEDYARAGDMIRLSLTLDTAVMNGPTVMFVGKTGDTNKIAMQRQGMTNEYRADYTVETAIQNPDLADGPFTFSSMVTSDNNFSSTFTPESRIQTVPPAIDRTTPAPPVIDRIPPSISSAEFTDPDMIIVTLSEPLAHPAATIEGYTYGVTAPDDTNSPADDDTDVDVIALAMADSAVTPPVKPVAYAAGPPSTITITLAGDVDEGVAHTVTLSSELTDRAGHAFTDTTEDATYDPPRASSLVFTVLSGDTAKSGTYASWAGIGNTLRVDLDLDADADVDTPPLITLAGRGVDAVAMSDAGDTDASTWRHEHTVLAGHASTTDSAQFDISIAVTGTTGNRITVTHESGLVQGTTVSLPTIDTTRPELDSGNSLHTVTRLVPGSGDNELFTAGIGNEILVILDATEQLITPALGDIASSGVTAARSDAVFFPDTPSSATATSAITAGSSDHVYHYSRTIEAGDPEGPVTFTITIRDRAGNESSSPITHSTLASIAARDPDTTDSDPYGHRALIDSSVPTLSLARTTATTGLAMTVSEMLPSAADTDAGDWLVTDGSTMAIISDATLSGSTITLTYDNIPDTSYAPTVTYSGSELVDAGRHAVVMGSMLVAQDRLPPTVSNARFDEAGDILVDLSEPIAAPPAMGYTAMPTGIPVGNDLGALTPEYTPGATVLKVVTTNSPTVIPSTYALEMPAFRDMATPSANVQASTNSLSVMLDDTTPPTFTEASFTGPRTIVLTASEPLDATTVTDTSFTVALTDGTAVALATRDDDAQPPVAPVSYAAGSTTVTLTLAAIAASEAIHTISPSTEIDDANSVDYGGATIDARAPDTQPPAFIEASFADPRTIVLTASEPLDAATVNDASFTVALLDGTAVALAERDDDAIPPVAPVSYAAGSTTVTLTLAATAASEAIHRISPSTEIDDANSVDYGGATIDARAPDTTPPTAISAAFEDSTHINVTFSEPVTTGGTWTAPESLGAVSAAEGSGPHVVRLTVATAATADTAYEFGVPDELTDRAIALNRVAASTTVSATFAADTTPPTAISAAFEDSTHINVTFSEPVTTGGTWTAPESLGAVSAAEGSGPHVVRLTVATAATADTAYEFGVPDELTDRAIALNRVAASTTVSATFAADTTPPTAISAAFEDSTHINVTFSEPVTTGGTWTAPESLGAVSAAEGSGPHVVRLTVATAATADTAYEFGVPDELTDRAIALNRVAASTTVSATFAADTTPPTAISAAFEDSTHINVTFSEPVTTGGTWTAPESLGAVSAAEGSGPHVVRLTVATAATADTAYEFGVPDELTDRAIALNRVAASTTVSATFAADTTPPTAISAAFEDSTHINVTFSEPVTTGGTWTAPESLGAVSAAEGSGPHVVRLTVATAATADTAYEFGVPDELTDRAIALNRVAASTTVSATFAADTTPPTAISAAFEDSTHINVTFSEPVTTGGTWTAPESLGAVSAAEGSGPHVVRLTVATAATADTAYEFGVPDELTDRAIALNRVAASTTVSATFAADTTPPTAISAAFEDSTHINVTFSEPVTTGGTWTAPESLGAVSAAEGSGPHVVRLTVATAATADTAYEFGVPDELTDRAIALNRVAASTTVSATFAADTTPPTAISAAFEDSTHINVTFSEPVTTGGTWTAPESLGAVSAAEGSGPHVVRLTVATAATADTAYEFGVPDELTDRAIALNRVAASTTVSATFAADTTPPTAISAAFEDSTHINVTFSEPVTTGGTWTAPESLGAVSAAQGSGPHVVRLTVATAATADTAYEFGVPDELTDRAIALNRVAASTTVSATFAADTTPPTAISAAFEDSTHINVTFSEPVTTGGTWTAPESLGAVSAAEGSGPHVVRLTVATAATADTAYEFGVPDELTDRAIALNRVAASTTVSATFAADTTPPTAISAAFEDSTHINVTFSEPVTTGGTWTAPESLGAVSAAEGSGPHVVRLTVATAATADTAYEFGVPDELTDRAIALNRVAASTTVSATFAADTTPPTAISAAFEDSTHINVTFSEPVTTGGTWTAPESLGAVSAAQGSGPHVVRLTVATAATADTAYEFGVPDELTDRAIALNRVAASTTVSATFAADTTPPTAISAAFEDSTHINVTFSEPVTTGGTWTAPESLGAVSAAEGSGPHVVRLTVATAATADTAYEFGVPDELTDRAIALNRVAASTTVSATFAADTTPPTAISAAFEDSTHINVTFSEPVTTGGTWTAPESLGAVSAAEGSGPHVVRLTVATAATADTAYEFGVPDELTDRAIALNRVAASTTVSATFAADTTPPTAISAAFEDSTHINVTFSEPVTTGGTWTAPESLGAVSAAEGSGPHVVRLTVATAATADTAYEFGVPDELTDRAIALNRVAASTTVSATFAADTTPPTAISAAFEDSTHINVTFSEPVTTGGTWTAPESLGAVSAAEGSGPHVVRLTVATAATADTAYEFGVPDELTDRAIALNRVAASTTVSATFAADTTPPTAISAAFEDSTHINVTFSEPVTTGGTWTAPESLGAVSAAEGSGPHVVRLTVATAATADTAYEFGVPDELTDRAIALNRVAASTTVSATFAADTTPPTAISAAFEDSTHINVTFSEPVTTGGTWTAPESLGAVSAAEGSGPHVVRLTVATAATADTAYEFGVPDELTDRAIALNRVAASTTVSATFAADTTPPTAISAAFEDSTHINVTFSEPVTTGGTWTAPESLGAVSAAEGSGPHVVRLTVATAATADTAYEFGVPDELTDRAIALNRVAASTTVSATFAADTTPPTAISAAFEDSTHINVTFSEPVTTGGTWTAPESLGAVSAAEGSGPHVVRLTVATAATADTAYEFGVPDELTDRAIALNRVAASTTVSATFAADTTPPTAISAAFEDSTHINVTFSEPVTTGGTWTAPESLGAVSAAEGSGPHVVRLTVATAATADTAYEFGVPDELTDRAIALNRVAASTTVSATFAADTTPPTAISAAFEDSTHINVTFSEPVTTGGTWTAPESLGAVSAAEGSGPHVVRLTVATAATADTAYEFGVPDELTDRAIALNRVAASTTVSATFAADTTPPTAISAAFEDSTHINVTFSEPVTTGGTWTAPESLGAVSAAQGSGPHVVRLTVATAATADTAYEFGVPDELTDRAIALNRVAASTTVSATFAADTTPPTAISAAFEDSTHINVTFSEPVTTGGTWTAPESLGAVSAAQGSGPHVVRLTVATAATADTAYEFGVPDELTDRAIALNRVAASTTVSATFAADTTPPTAISAAFEDSTHINVTFSEPVTTGGTWTAPESLGAVSAAEGSGPHVVRLTVATAATADTAYEFGVPDELTDRAIALNRVAASTTVSATFAADTTPPTAISAAFEDSTHINVTFSEPVTTGGTWTAPESLGAVSAAEGSGPHVVRLTVATAATADTAYEFGVPDELTDRAIALNRVAASTTVSATFAADTTPPTAISAAFEDSTHINVTFSEPVTTGGTWTAPESLGAVSAAEGSGPHVVRLTVATAATADTAYEFGVPDELTDRAIALNRVAASTTVSATFAADTTPPTAISAAFEDSTHINVTFSEPVTTGGTWTAPESLGAVSAAEGSGPHVVRLTVATAATADTAYEFGVPDELTDRAIALNRVAASTTVSATFAADTTPPTAISAAFEDSTHINVTFSEPVTTGGTWTAPESLGAVSAAEGSGPHVVRLTVATAATADTAYEFGVPDELTDRAIALNRVAASTTVSATFAADTTPPTAISAAFEDSTHINVTFSEPVTTGGTWTAPESLGAVSAAQGSGPHVVRLTVATAATADTAYEFGVPDELTDRAIALNRVAASTTVSATFAADTTPPTAISAAFEDSTHINVTFSEPVTTGGTWTAPESLGAVSAAQGSGPHVVRLTVATAATADTAYEFGVPDELTDRAIALNRVAASTTVSATFAADTTPPTAISAAFEDSTHINVTFSEPVTTGGTWTAPESLGAVSAAEGSGPHVVRLTVATAATADTAYEFGVPDELTDRAIALNRVAASTTVSATFAADTTPPTAISAAFEDSTHINVTFSEPVTTGGTWTAPESLGAVSAAEGSGPHVVRLTVATAATADTAYEFGVPDELTDRAIALNRVAASTTVSATFAADTTPPTAISAAFEDSTHINVTFSEPVTTGGTWTAPESLGAVSAAEGSGPHVVRLTVATAATADTAYEFGVPDELTDRAIALNRVAASTTVSATFAADTTPPTAISAAFEDSTHINVTFSEPVTTGGTWTAPESLGAVSAAEGSGPHVVRLTVATAATADTAYEFGVPDELTDRAIALNRVAASTTVSATFAADTTPPTAISAAFEDSTHINVTFSEPVTTGGTWTAPESLGAVSAAEGSGPHVVRLTVATAATADTAYEFGVPDELTDRAIALNRVAASTTVSATFAADTTPPTAISAAFEDSTHINVTFSEPVTTGGTWTAPESLGAVSAAEGSGPHVVRLTVATAATADTAYEFGVPDELTDRAIALNRVAASTTVSATFAADTTPPTAISAAFEDSTHIDVTFSEAVRTAGTWTAPASLGAVTAAQGSAPNIVRLTVATAATADTAYEFGVPDELTDRAIALNRVAASTTVSATFAADTTPPTAISAAFEDSTHIDVTFSEAVRTAGTWTAPASLGAVTAAQGSAPNIVRLTVATAATADTAYEFGVPDELTDRALTPNRVAASTTVDATFNLDTTPPTFSAATVELDRIAIRFSEPVSGMTSPADWRVGGTQVMSIAGSTGTTTLTGATSLTLNLAQAGRLADGSATPAVVYSGSGLADVPVGARDPNPLATDPVTPTDGIAPSAIRAVFVDATTINVTFSEAVTPSSSGWTVEGLGVTSVEPGSTGEIVALTVSPPAIVGSAYDIGLTTASARDAAANAPAAQTIPGVLYQGIVMYTATTFRDLGLSEHIRITFVDDVRGRTLPGEWFVGVNADGTGGTAAGSIARVCNAGTPPLVSSGINVDAVCGTTPSPAGEERTFYLAYTITSSADTPRVAYRAGTSATPIVSALTGLPVSATAVTAADGLSPLFEAATATTRSVTVTFDEDVAGTPDASRWYHYDSAATPPSQAELDAAVAAGTSFAAATLDGRTLTLTLPDSHAPTSGWGSDDTAAVPGTIGYHMPQGAAADIVDAAAAPNGLAANTADATVADGVPPEAATITLAVLEDPDGDGTFAAKSGAHAHIAGTGDEVSVSVTLSEASSSASPPELGALGESVTMALSNSDMTATGTIEVPSTWTRDGSLEFSITASDAAASPNTSVFTHADASTQILVDVSAPTITSAFQISAGSVQLNFSEPLVGSGTVSVSPAAGTGSPAAIMLHAGGTAATAALSLTGMAYTFTLEASLVDMAGNPVAPQEVTVDADGSFTTDVLVIPASPDCSDSLSAMTPGGQFLLVLDNVGADGIICPHITMGIEERITLTIPPRTVVESFGSGSERLIRIEITDRLSSAKMVDPMAASAPAYRGAGSGNGADASAALAIRSQEPDILALIGKADPSAPILFSGNDISVRLHGAAHASHTFYIAGAALEEVHSIVSCADAGHEDASAVTPPSLGGATVAADIAECTVTDGDDTVIWTNHFTLFGSSMGDVSNGGSACDDCTPPTLGVDSTGTRRVTNGFSYNGEPVDAGYYYTPMPLITVVTGEENVATLKVFEDSGARNVRHVGLGFGLTRNQHFAESEAEIRVSLPFSGEPTVSLDDPANAIDPDSLRSESVMGECMAGSEAECRIVTIYHTFREPLEFNVVSTIVWDDRRNAWQNFFNHGVHVTGESLNPRHGIEVNGGELVLYPLIAGQLDEDGDGVYDYDERHVTYMLDEEYRVYRLTPDGTYRPVSNLQTLHHDVDVSMYAEGRVTWHTERGSSLFDEIVSRERTIAEEYLRLMGVRSPGEDSGEPPALATSESADYDAHIQRLHERIAHEINRAEIDAAALYPAISAPESTP